MTIRAVIAMNQPGTLRVVVNTGVHDCIEFQVEVNRKCAREAPAYRTLRGQISLCRRAIRATRPNSRIGAMLTLLHVQGAGLKESAHCQQAMVASKCSRSSIVTDAASMSDSGTYVTSTISGVDAAAGRGKGTEWTESKVGPGTVTQHK